MTSSIIPRSIQLASLTLGGLGLFSCASHPPLPTPPPPPLPLMAKIPPAPFSTLRIPLQVNLDYVRDKVVASIPKPLSQKVQQKKVELGGSIPFAPSVGVEFRHRAELENLDIQLQGDQLQAVARVGFTVGSSMLGGNLNMGLASCGETTGEPSAAIDFTVRGQLTWGDDGKLNLRQMPWEMRWIRPCVLSAFKVRLEDILDLPMVRDKMQGAITMAVQKIPEAMQLRPLAQKAWNEMSKPREVLPGMRLLVRPESLSVGPLSGNGKTLFTSITLRAHPSLTDSLLHSDSIRPLPPIRVEALGEGLFHLEAQAGIPLSIVDSLMTASLTNKTFDAGGRTVKIGKAWLYGGGDRAVLGLTMIQPFAGDIFLKGKPLFDSATNKILLSEVDFDLETRSMLAKSADFLLHGTIKEAIAKAAVVDISKYLPKLSDLRLPAGDIGEAAVSLQSLRPMGISLDQGRLQAWLQAEGRAVFKVGTASPR